jgi:hypothetical protein
MFKKQLIKGLTILGFSGMNVFGMESSINNPSDNISNQQSDFQKFKEDIEKIRHMDKNVNINTFVNEKEAISKIYNENENKSKTEFRNFYSDTNKEIQRSLVSYLIDSIMNSDSVEFKILQPKNIVFNNKHFELNLKIEENITVILTYVIVFTEEEEEIENKIQENMKKYENYIENLLNLHKLINTLDKNEIDYKSKKQKFINDFSSELNKENYFYFLRYTLHLKEKYKDNIEDLQYKIKDLEFDFGYLINAHRQIEKMYKKRHFKILKIFKKFFPLCISK